MISSHFSWDEVTASATAKAKGIDNRLPDEFTTNVKRTAALMEEVRLLVGGPITVTSWFRSPTLNKAIGGATNSYHMQGLAVDFKVNTMRLNDAFDKIAASSIVFDQLIHEQTKDGARWIHIGLCNLPLTPRRQVLKASGTMLGGKMAFTRVASG